MSSRWKAPIQKTKRERQQPASRAHLGILEKHSDYVIRAKAANKKRAEIHRLEQEAALRNPDEFYYSMVSDKERKAHEIPKKINGFSKEQMLLLRTQSKEYIEMKIRAQENKIQRLELGLPQERTTRYFRTVEEAMAAAQAEKEQRRDEPPELAAVRDELQQRQTMLQQLRQVLNEMQLRRDKETDPSFKEYKTEDGRTEHIWTGGRKR